MGEYMVGKITGARYTELDAAHISNVEAPERFTEALAGFVAG
jgi:hypothetical protein